MLAGVGVPAVRGLAARRLAALLLCAQSEALAAARQAVGEVVGNLRASRCRLCFGSGSREAATGWLEGPLAGSVCRLALGCGLVVCGAGMFLVGRVSRRRARACARAALTGALHHVVSML